MATPQELTTTVSGRRCTRSRARTAASSTLTSEPAEVTPTELTPSTTINSEPQQIPTGPADAPPAQPPPPPPVNPPSSTPEQAPDVAPTSRAAASSSAIGTSIAALPSERQPSVLATVSPLAPAAVAPGPTPDSEDTGEIVSAAAASPIASTTTRSDSNTAAITPTLSRPPRISLRPSNPARPSTFESSFPPVSGLPSESAFPSNFLSGQPSRDPQSTETGIPSGGDGIISPDQGSGDEGSLTIPNGGQTNIASIVGGVVGGFVGIVLISALLFLCLRKRKLREPELQQHMNEKDDGRQKGVGVFFAKLGWKKSTPAENPYRRHSARSSVSSIYSVGSDARGRSISEPEPTLRQQLRGFGGRMPSLKRSKTLLEQNRGAGNPFQDPVHRYSRDVDNPFADPTPEASNNLAAMHPDIAKAQKAVLDGLQDQQRAPITPKSAKDPFTTIMRELAARNGSGTPEWLKATAQKRKQIAASALRSHPPSPFNPFADPSAIPPVPSQPLPANPPTRPPSTYAPMPTFSALSSANSRDSNSSLLLGAPDPNPDASRPSTNAFSTPGRFGRQSDPFDLDVLVLGNVSGRREVRASVTRQNSNSRSSRTSTVPNWASAEDAPNQRVWAGLGTYPLRKPSVRR
ncbi:hypothetical protein BDV95DRAFT_556664 [Massariosphaeria phaeospora]|uniref:Uncharacterized protein n=1 Tax=Massariosphaeria phaeospora TaxID=100035 RepID=A0A7C8IIL1_9PLEO|nr:hypothetical protein BDV95DRAFT_556664 [Massariosphaeria phaeospora]